MLIASVIVQRILDNAKVEFNGLHGNTPGWDRAAYYRIDGHKVTFRVYSLNPRQKALNKQLFNELRKRLSAVGDRVTIDYYGRASMTHHDPYGVETLLQTYVYGQYMDIPYKPKEK